MYMEIFLRENDSKNSPRCIVSTLLPLISIDRGSGWYAPDLQLTTFCVVNMLAYLLRLSITWTLFNQWFHFSLLSIILADLSENRSSLQQVELWFVDFNPFCLFLFQGPLVVVVILLWLTAAKNAIICMLGFELQSHRPVTICHWVPCVFSI